MSTKTTTRRASGGTTQTRSRHAAPAVAIIEAGYSDGNVPSGRNRAARPAVEGAKPLRKPAAAQRPQTRVERQRRGRRPAAAALAYSVWREWLVGRGQEIWAGCVPALRRARGDRHLLGSGRRARRAHRRRPRGHRRADALSGAGAVHRLRCAVARSRGADDGPTRGVLGLVLLLVSATGLLHVIRFDSGDSDLGNELVEAGGGLGALSGYPLGRLAGGWGAALVLLVVAAVGVLILTRSTVRSAGENVAGVAQGAAAPLGRAIIRGIQMLFQAPTDVEIEPPSTRKRVKKVADTELIDLTEADRDDDRPTEPVRVHLPEPPPPVTEDEVVRRSRRHSAHGLEAAPAQAAGPIRRPGGGPRDRRAGRPHAGARLGRTRRRDPPGRHGRRPHGHPLRTGTRPRRQGRPGHQPAQGHRLRHGQRRCAHPGAHSRPPGDRRRGPQRQASAGDPGRHPVLRRGPPGETPARGGHGPRHLRQGGDGQPGHHAPHPHRRPDRCRQVVLHQHADHLGARCAPRPTRCG